VGALAGARRSARQRGKSNAIDALAVARAALREPSLPAARLQGPEREIRFCSIIAMISSPRGSGRRIGCVGTCTNSTRSLSCQLVASIAAAGWSD
jgi:hypothetical protein